MQLRDICTKVDVCLLYFDLALVVETHQLHELVVPLSLASQNDSLAEGHKLQEACSCSDQLRPARQQLDDELH